MSVCEDEAIANRLLYKEKLPLRTLTQKCLLIDKTVKAEALCQLFNEIEEELEAVEYSYEKQLLIKNASLRDQEAFAQQIKVFEAERSALINSIDSLKDEIGQASKSKANMLEFEEVARQINALPSKVTLGQEIEDIDGEIAALNAEIEYKQEVWDKAAHYVKIAADALGQITTNLLD